MKQVEDLIRKGEGTIIDVRTPAEFSSGHVERAVNIPLNEVPQRLEELKNLQLPLLLCCASGVRSGQAYRQLTAQGLECYNAGSWMNVNYFLSKK
ncbi:MAG: rhodanese-like domain-containing protein [Bacteroidia bacterium]